MTAVAENPFQNHRAEFEAEVMRRFDEIQQAMARMEAVHVNPRSTGDPLLTLAQVAEHFNVKKPNTIQEWVKRGEFPAPDEKLGRYPRWKRSTVEKGRRKKRRRS